MSDAPVAFFSYSREDSEFALRLAADLRAAGANVWIDQLDIGPGQRWDRSVQDALENCPSVLIILSPASVNSNNVLDEVSFALDKQKMLIPILHRDCEIPFRIRRFQHLDFRTDYDRMLLELQRCLHLGGVPHSASAGSPDVTPSNPPPMPKTSPVERSTPAVERTSPPSPIPTPRPQPVETAPPTGGSRSALMWVAIPVLLILLIGGIYWAASSSSAKPPGAGRGSTTGNPGQPQPVSGSFELVGAALGNAPTSPPCTLPQTSETQFSVSDPGAWFFFAYHHGDLSDRWTVDWVEPNGYVHKTDTVAHTETGARYCFEMKIAGTPAQKAPGEWTVRLNRNGNEVAERKFTMSR